MVGANHPRYSTHEMYLSMVGRRGDGETVGQRDGETEKGIEGEGG